MTMLKVLQSYTPAGVYMGRIDYGQDILESLELFCREHSITTAWVNLMGALSAATLSYYNQQTRQYVARPFEGEFEILNGTGNISLKDNAPFGHVHLTLSGTDFNCIGGHLVKGTTKVFACEFILFVLDGPAPLIRMANDEQTGLALWV